MRAMRLSWLVFLCVIFSACSSNLPPADYDVSEVGKMKKVVPGVIISKRAVKFHDKKAERANTDATTAPTTDYIEGGHGVVYVIKLNTGAIVSVAQKEDLKLKVKQHILVVYGKHTRVLPDDGSED